MRRDLAGVISAPVWPEGVALKPFTAADAPAVHALLQLAYRDGDGMVGSYAEWWQLLSTDREYDPALCFTAWAGEQIVGMAQCWTSAFVKDLCVHPDWQRRGVASALLLAAFRMFRDGGESSVDLKVQASNAAAICFYQTLGMVEVS